MLGIAISWFAWLDAQTTNGKTCLTAAQLDAELGMPGLADGLIAIGWAKTDKHNEIVALDFAKHNGNTAKSRAEHANRQAKYRAKLQASAAAEAKPKPQKSKAPAEETAPPKPPPAAKKYVVPAPLPAAVPEAPPAPMPKAVQAPMPTPAPVSKAVPVAAPPPAMPQAAAVPSRSPQMNWQERPAFGRWLQQLCEVVPMLRRLNPDAPLPPPVEEGGQRAFRLVPMEPDTLQQIKRYYAAENVQSYRPHSLEFFFRDLPDVLQHAENWCRADDEEQRKAKRKAERKAQAAAEEARKRENDGELLGYDQLGDYFQELHELVEGFRPS